MTDERLKRVVAYINSYADPVAPDDTVTVPRDLLRKVLSVAMADSKIAERHAGPDFTHWAKDRARIAELRRAAGMEEDHG